MLICGWQAEARTAQLQSEQAALQQRAGAAEARVAELQQQVASERVARQQQAVRITTLEAQIKDFSQRKVRRQLGNHTILAAATTAQLRTQMLAAFLNAHGANNWAQLMSFLIYHLLVCMAGV